MAVKIFHVSGKSSRSARGSKTGCTSVKKQPVMVNNEQGLKFHPRLSQESKWFGNFVMNLDYSDKN